MFRWPVLHLGTWAAGGAVVGSSPAFKLYETTYQLTDSFATVVMVAEEQLGMIMEAAKECPAVKTIICVRSSKTPLPEGVVNFGETIRQRPLDELAPVTLDTPCMVYYSSGTTGLPKGIVHTHRTFHCAVELMISHWQHEIYPILCEGDFDWYQEHQVISAACYHLNWFLITGSPVVLMKSFDGEVYRDAIEMYKPRYLSVNPAIFSYLSKDSVGRKTPLSSVQMILCASAPLSQELSDEFLAAHPNVKYVVQGYGMTEIDYSHLPLLLEEGVNASAGVVASFFEQKIVNPDNIAPCKPGERGELWVRGAAQTIGYLNKPEATKDLIDEQGWIHTGDIGYIDNRGLLYIVDRIKELIKVNYNNTTNRVPPAELEGVLLSNNKIRDAAIVGIPDIKYGKLVRAFVVKADEKLMEEEVEEFIADKLAEFKRITGGVVFVDAIPRSPAGKILRRVLKEVHGA